jgi:hypothetical protein
MSVNHVLTKNNSKTNWINANNLENVVYKLTGNGTEYVFSNPNTFAKFLGQNKNALNAYLNGLNRNANITVRIGNRSSRIVRGPFGPIKPRQVQKVRLVGERNASPPVNLSKLMANMRFTAAAPQPNAAALANAERNSRNALRLLLEAAVNKFRNGINSGELPVNKLRNGSYLNKYIRNKGMTVPGSNEEIIEMANIAYKSSRRAMINRSRTARTAVSSRRAINEGRNSVTRTLF